MNRIAGVGEVERGNERAVNLGGQVELGPGRRGVVLDAPQLAEDKDEPQSDTGDGLDAQERDAGLARAFRERLEKAEPGEARKDRAGHDDLRDDDQRNEIETAGREGVFPSHGDEPGNRRGDEASDKVGVSWAAIISIGPMAAKVQKTPACRSRPGPRVLRFERRRRTNADSAPAASEAIIHPRITKASWNRAQPMRMPERTGRPK